MNYFKPVVLLASERSGTNLLRALLDTHSSIASPPPCGVIDLMPNIAHRYLLPWNPTHLNELAEDVCTLTQIHMNPWDVDLNVEMIASGLSDISFWGIFARLNEIYARHHSAKCWFSKEPGLCRHIYAIHKHIPEAQFIYMVRDGRDVASSLLQHGLHEGHIYPAARRWIQEQRMCLSAMSDTGLTDHMLMIRYEDLVASPESELARIMKFIGLDMEPEQLNFHRREKTMTHAARSVFWSNLAKPINAGSKGRYNESLTRRQIRAFESVAWTEMRCLGYDPENRERPKLSKQDIWGFRVSQFFRELFGRSSPDRQELARRRQRADRIKKILSRFESI